MDDLISRQAAIDALLNEVEPFGVMDKNGKLKGAGVYDVDVIKMLESLPSAQQWISVSERLPEKDGRYLVTNSAWGAFDVDWNVWANGEWLFPNSKPIAWMPLPEPYDGGNDGEIR